MRNTLQNSPPPYKPEEEETQKEDDEFTCQICIEPTSNKFKNGDKCSHPFCVDCMSKYIRIKLDHDNDGHIKCPALNCDNELDPFAWAPAIGSQLFVRWCDVLCEEALVDRGKCYCPYLNCNALIVNECGGNPTNSKCPSCTGLFCFQCKRVWHKKFSCAQNADLTDDANDVAFVRLVEAKGWIRCPRCSHFVEKGLGCQFVKCRCRAILCYHCGKQTQNYKCPWCNEKVRSMRDILITLIIGVLIIIGYLLSPILMR